MWFPYLCRKEKAREEKVFPGMASGFCGMDARFLSRSGVTFWRADIRLLMMDVDCGNN